MNRNKIFIALFASILVLGVVAGVTAKSGVPSQTSNFNLAQSERKIRLVDIEVNQYGVIFFDLTYYSENPVSFDYIGYPSGSEELNNLVFVGIQINKENDFAILTVMYAGEVSESTTYRGYAEDIINSIQNKLGLTVTSSSDTVSYIGTYENYGTVTFFKRTVYFSDEASVVESKVKTFCYGFTDDPFHEYLTTQNQEITDFKLYISLNTTESQFRLIYTAQFDTINYQFSGNGTHTFSLKEVTGLTSAITGSNYWVDVKLPSGASINASSYSGPVHSRNVIYNNVAYILVESTDNFSDITFQFTYNFQSTSSGGGSEGGEGGGENGGENVGGEESGGEQSSGDFGGNLGSITSSPIIYVVAGVAVLAIVGVALRSFLRR